MSVAADPSIDRRAARPFGLPLSWLIGLGTYAILALAGQAVLADPDPYWHVAAGRWIIAHGTVPHSDPFSYSVAGAPWVPTEWLSQVILATLYNLFGWNGLIGATAVACALAMTLLSRTLSRLLPPLWALGATAAAFAVCLPHLLARPHVFALPFFVLWIGTLVEARAEERAPPPFLALLLALWANIHGSYLLGLVFATLFAGEAVLAAATASRRWQAIRVWGVFLALCTAASLATPNGIESLLMPFRTESMSYALTVVTEWRSPDFQHFQPLEAWLVLALFGALAAGLRLPPTRVAMTLLLLHLGLAHQRHAELLALIVPLLVAHPLAAQLAASASGQPSRANIRGFIVATAILALVSVTAFGRGFARTDDPVTPAAAVNFVADHHVTGPVLNAYGFGGYLIFAGIRPYIDGRAEIYGDAFLKRFVEATQGRSSELPMLLAENHIGWTLFEPNSPAVVLLDHLPGWHRLYADKFAVVHGRIDTALR